MKISDAENIQEIFNIFHDGCICSYKIMGEDIVLEVEIEYLAERINPDFRKFHLTLFQVQNIEFEPWFNDRTRKEPPRTDYESIFTPELSILSADLEGDALKISCNQSEVKYGYCGGFLKVKADAATVQDENGSFYSLVQLQDLCSAYWKESVERHAQRFSQNP